jgi:hypothetical protein
VTVDQRTGVFRPGRTNESAVVEEGELVTSSISELEIVVELGPTRATRSGSTAPRATTRSTLVSAARRSARPDHDVEIRTAERYFLAPITCELHGAGGRNTLSARGAAPTGLGAHQIIARLYAGDLGDTLRGGDLDGVPKSAAGARLLSPAADSSATSLLRSTERLSSGVGPPGGHGRRKVVQAR